MSSWKNAVVRYDNMDTKTAKPRKRNGKNTTNYFDFNNTAVPLQQVTYHLSNDRIDRAMIIYERLGWDIGEEIYCAPFPDSNGRMGLRVLTSKGVIVCKNIETKIAVTMFVATPHQVRELYGQDRMPAFIANIVLKNQKKFADIIG